MRRDEGVTVTGSASVDVVPDIVLATLGVDVRSDDLATALRTAESSLARMRDVFLEGGVDRSGIASTRSAIWREDRPGEHGQILATVMHVRLGLRVTLRSAAAAGDLVHAAVAAAGADASMDSLDFAVSDSTEAMARARDAAFDNAREIAAGYAARAGRGLGQVRAIVEGLAGDTISPRTTFAAMEKGRASMPVEPGQQAVTAAVTVTWELAD
ncbi:SIMPL domain-containing protein [Pseudactinotalea terrae]|uniref:SIMPL domain-containing protein n=1 Tax=Pseudactinotalea terrae TaxID=1743262 RepID=UPI0012E2A5EC|nr:SIMPL domain-containing protein [Pseudactinotalea terrae]